MNLWPHQTAAIGAAQSAIEDGTAAGLLAMPTGTGKTFMFSTLAARLNWPTLVLVHRDELVRQTEQTLEIAWPRASVGVVQAQRDEWQDLDVVIASVQSLYRRRLRRMPPDLFSLIVADEAHHAVAPSWAAVLDHFDSRFTLGCTATPERADGRGLAERFGDRPLYVYPLRQAIDDGRLSRLVQYAVETSADLGGVAYRRGDFARGELSDAVNTPQRNGCVVEAYQQHADGRRALAFTVDVQHARDLCAAFSEVGIVAAVVSGKTPIDERRATLKDFAAGNIRVVCNCAVLTEGFDDPGVSAILMARPTCSRTLYTQCIGRGLRTAAGKRDCLVLDYVDNSRRHKLVTLLDLLGAPHARDASGQDVLQVVDEDVAEAEHKHEIASTRPLSWRLARVCPWPSLPSLAGHVPSAWWHLQPATEAQLRYLASFGVDLSRELTKGEASYLIDRLREYEATYPTLATSKQRYYLERVGMWREGLSIKEARRLIGELKRGEARVTA